MGTGFDRLTPGLGQVFFVGDGLTGTGEGATQTFVAPAGATRLFLGTVDAQNFFGLPGCYGDNSGSYQMHITGSTPLSLRPAGSQGSAGVSATPPAGATTAARATATKAPTAEAGATSPAGLASGPKSYRIHTVTRQDDPQGAVKDDGLVEAVMDPLAFHTKSTGEMLFEVVILGHTFWTRFDDMPWRKTDLTDEDLAAQLQQFSQTESPVNIKEQTPLEDEIGWLLGQPSLQIAKGSLSRSGEEKVNGVACKHYTVDSTYTYTVEMTVPIKATATVTIQFRASSGWPTRTGGRTLWCESG